MRRARADNQSVNQRPAQPWKVFGFIGFLIACTAFGLLNYDHRSDVSLGFHTFAAAPVFLTSLIALTLGTVLGALLNMRPRGVAPRALPPPPAAAPAPLAPERDAKDPVNKPARPSDRKLGALRRRRRRRNEAPD